MRTALELMLLGFALEILVGVGALQASQPSGKEIHRVETVVVHSQPSFLLANDQVQLGVTEIGGHMAPVKFFADSKMPIEPYYISPWQDEPKTAMPAPVLSSLRGDFFCSRSEATLMPSMAKSTRRMARSPGRNGKRSALRMTATSPR